MAVTRKIYCSSCGAPLNVPRAARPGRKVRCAQCEHVFEIPRPLGASKDIPAGGKPPTRVGSFDIDSLPDDLRAKIRAPQPEDARDRGPTFPTLAEQPRWLREGDPDEPEPAREPTSRDEPEVPRTRTGAGFIDITKLVLDLEDEPEDADPS